MSRHHYSQIKRDNLIVEELCISDEVRKYSDGIFSAIKDEHLDRFNYPLWGDVYKVSIDLEKTEDYADLQQYDGYADTDNKELNIKIYHYEGKILWNILRSAIIHEHIYQQHMQGLRESGEGLYDIAVGILTTPNKYNIYERRIAYSIYYSDRQEQDAIVNELYGSLIGLSNVGKDFGGTTATLSLALKDLSNENVIDHYGIILRQYYNINVNWYRSLVERSLKRLQEKIRKVVAKIRKDSSER